jgi:prolyl oligopeptidase
MSMSALGQDPTEEVIHGVTVTDPHRRLEDRGSPETEDWILEQKRRHDTYFAAISGLDQIRAHVKLYLNVETIDQLAKIGNLYFYRRRQVDQEQACICVREIASGRERVLVDPCSLGPFASVGIHRISDDGRLLVYEVKNGGGDAKAIRIVDVSSGSTLSDGIQNGYARGFVFAAHNTGYYYSHDPVGSTSDHSIRFHRWGDKLDLDPIVFWRARTQHSKLILIGDDCNLGAVWVHNIGTDIFCDLYIASLDGDLDWTLVLKDKQRRYQPFLKYGRIFAVTGALTGDMTGPGLRRRRIVEIAEDGTESRVVVPDCGHEIQEFSMFPECICVSYAHDEGASIRCYTPAGQFTGELVSCEQSSVRLLPSFSNQPESLFYSRESFTQPLSITEYRPGTAESISWARDCTAFAGPKFRVRRITYRAKDGTQVPISLVAREDIDATTEHPVILTSYGGFGVSMTPRFSVLVRIMLEFAAVFALPSIRGGSGVGSEWHEAARARSRQIAFDDFLSAAEWLCSERVTNPSKLAIFGGSNSGLLVAAAMTQRPALFRAVLCVAPLLDMVRYERFDQARKWNQEYGTVDDPEDFRGLYGYSPYHHVEPDQDYPATLFVSGDKDDRCNPAHVRKMVARLQNRSAQKCPVLVDYSPERGHSPVLPLSIRIDALTRRIAFLCRELGIPY